MTEEMAIHNLYALKQRTRALSNHEALAMAIEALEKNIQPETCPITNGVCGYPIEDCCNCPNIKAVVEQQRWIPILLKEHDAEPRRLKAILDVETNGIYILETTKGFAEGMGMTIEEVEE